MPRYCEVDGCLELAHPNKGGKCSAHFQRQVRGKLLNAPKANRGQELTPFQTLMEGALNLANFDDQNDDGFERGKARFKKQVERFGARAAAEKIKRLETQLATVKAERDAARARIASLEARLSSEGIFT